MSKILSNLPDGVSQRMVSEFFDYEETVVGPQDPITEEDIVMKEHQQYEEEKIEVLIGLMCSIDNIDIEFLFEEDGSVIKIQDAGDINDLCLHYLETLTESEYRMAFNFIESHFNDFKQRLLDKI